MPSGIYKRVKGESYGMLGKHHSLETVEKIRTKKLGSRYPNRKSPKLFTKEHREKIGNASRGEKHPNWKGGITSENTKIRRSRQYKKWCYDVFKRDKFTCQKTGKRGNDLIAHHILNFSDYPELRFNIDNGITLSDVSHREFHKKYGRKNNTKEQLLEFLS